MRGGGERRRRNRNSGLVRWRLLDRNVLCQDSLCLGFTRPDHKLNWPSWRWSCICIFPNQGFKPDVASALQNRSFVIRGRAVSLSDLRKDLCCSCVVTLTIQKTLTNNVTSLGARCQNYKVLPQLSSSRVGHGPHCSSHIFVPFLHELKYSDPLIDHPQVWICFTSSSLWHLLHTNCCRKSWRAALPVHQNWTIFWKNVLKWCNM